MQIKKCNKFSPFSQIYGNATSQILRKGLFFMHLQFYKILLILVIEILDKQLLVSDDSIMSKLLFYITLCGHFLFNL